MKTSKVRAYNAQQLRRKAGREDLKPRLAQAESKIEHVQPPPDCCIPCDARGVLCGGRMLSEDCCLPCTKDMRVCRWEAGSETGPPADHNPFRRPSKAKHTESCLQSPLVPQALNVRPEAIDQINATDGNRVSDTDPEFSALAEVFSTQLAISGSYRGRQQPNADSHVVPRPQSEQGWVAAGRSLEPSVVNFPNSIRGESQASAKGQQTAIAPIWNLKSEHSSNLQKHRVLTHHTSMLDLHDLSWLQTPCNFEENKSAHQSFGFGRPITPLAEASSSLEENTHQSFDFSTSSTPSESWRWNPRNPFSSSWVSDSSLSVHSHVSGTGVNTENNQADRSLKSDRSDATIKPQTSQFHPRRQPGRRRDENEDDQGGQSKRAKTAEGHTSSRKFLCPFYKRNPSQIHHTACVHPGYDAIPRLKEHLYRCHRLKPRCERCQESFENAQLLRQHIRSDPPCPVTSDSDQAEPGLTKWQEERLRRNQGRGLSEEEKWYNIYATIFPLENRANYPSPYREDVSNARRIIDQVRLAVVGALGQVPPRLQSELDRIVRDREAETKIRTSRSQELVPSQSVAQKSQPQRSVSSASGTRNAVPSNPFLRNGALRSRTQPPSPDGPRQVFPPYQTNSLPGHSTFGSVSQLPYVQSEDNFWAPNQSPGSSLESSIFDFPFVGASSSGSPRYGSQMSEPSSLQSGKQNSFSPYGQSFFGFGGHE